MIKYIKGDLLSATDGLIIHGCNTRGAMGSGVAGAIRKKWPQVYEEFKKLNPSPDLLGYAQFVMLDNRTDVNVVNCFTQENFGNDGKIYADADAIRESVGWCFRFAHQFMRNVNSPKIGCGLGGLDWEDDVLPIFEELNMLYPDVGITIYEL